MIVAHFSSDLLKLRFTGSLVPINLLIIPSPALPFLYSDQFSPCAFLFYPEDGSKTMVPIYHTTWCHIPEDYNLDVTALETHVTHKLNPTSRHSLGVNRSYHTLRQTTYSACILRQVFIIFIIKTLLRCLPVIC
jgi:hypothetical protein